MTGPLTSLETQSTLLLRIRDPKDAEAWRAFVALYGPLLYRYARSKGLQDADAADVGQDVLTQVARSMATFTYQPERGRFRDWLGTVTRQRIGRFVESQRRGARASGGEEGGDVLGRVVAPQAEPEWTAEFNNHLLHAALARIRPLFQADNWRAFERVWFDQRPASEVAEGVGLPVAAVYVAKSRILKRLREEILLLAEDLPHFVPLA